MSDQPATNTLNAEDIQAELKAGRLSRRRLLDSLKVMGVGFGATYALGAGKAEAAVPGPSLNVTSTNEALNGIIQDSPSEEASAEGVEDGEPRLEQAQLYYRRYYYRRYFYRRYARYYYRRFYRRFYY